jgi:hypothetical protein
MPEIYEITDVPLAKVDEVKKVFTDDQATVQVIAQSGEYKTIIATYPENNETHKMTYSEFVAG